MIFFRRDDSVVNVLELDRANRGDVDVPLICRFHDDDDDDDDDNDDDDDICINVTITNGYRWFGP